MRRGDGGKRGYCQSRNKSMATWTSRIKCSVQPDQGLLGRAEVGSEGLITARWSIQWWRSLLLCILGKNRSFNAGVSLQWPGPLAHMKSSTLNKTNPTLSWVCLHSLNYSGGNTLPLLLHLQLPKRSVGAQTLFWKSSAPDGERWGKCLPGLKEEEIACVQVKSS